MTVDDLVLAAALITVGVTTGVMFCYQITIMPGLRQLTDDQFVQTFQGLDKATVNPLFVGLMFLGGAASLIVATALAFDERWSTSFTLLAASTVVYVVGVIVLTLTFHVPRNNALLALTVPSMSSQEVSAARAQFEGPWLRAHTLRTLAALASLAMLALAAVERSN